MTVCSRGDVVLIPFPFSNLSTVKQRPALVISSDEFNSTNKDVIVVAITSQIKPDGIREEGYKITGQEQVTAGLPKVSLVRFSKIVTIDKNMVRRVLGYLPKSTVDVIAEKIQVILS